MDSYAPSYLKQLYSPEQIRSEVQRLGKEMTPWARSVEASTGHQPLAVCVLRGALFFFCDILRAVDASIEPTVCRTWTYSSEKNQEQLSGVRVSVESVVAENRHILVIDDICDTGTTLAKLVTVFTDLGAKEVKTAVLIHRVMVNAKHTPDYAAFEYSGAEWLVGYGMEDENHYRNLQGVYVINK